MIPFHIPLQNKRYHVVLDGYTFQVMLLPLPKDGQKDVETTTNLYHKQGYLRSSRVIIAFPGVTFKQGKTSDVDYQFGIKNEKELQGYYYDEIEETLQVQYRRGIAMSISFNSSANPSERLSIPDVYLEFLFFKSSQVLNRLLEAAKYIDDLFFVPEITTEHLRSADLLQAQAYFYFLKTESIENPRSFHQLAKQPPPQLQSTSYAKLYKMLGSQQGILLEDTLLMSAKNHLLQRDTCGLALIEMEMAFEEIILRRAKKQGASGKTMKALPIPQVLQDKSKKFKEFNEEYKKYKKTSRERKPVFKSSVEPFQAWLEGYQLRCEIVHEGYKPSSGEAWVAFRRFTKAFKHYLNKDIGFAYRPSPYNR